MQLNFFARCMLPIATFIDLGAKSHPQRWPGRPPTDKTMRAKGSRKKSPPPDRAIEHTNRLRDCPNGVKWYQNSPQNGSESYTKRQPYRFKNHDCSVTVALILQTHFTDSFVKQHVQVLHIQFIASMRAQISNKTCFVAARARTQRHFSRWGAFL